MKTYIVLPFKDRNSKYKTALEEFINPFIDYLDKNLTDYELFIVEQLGGSLKNSLPKDYTSILNSLEVDQDEEFFNLGRTINIGYDILKHRIKDDDIFMFHPVDLMPIDVNYSVNKTTKLCYKVHSPDGRYYKSIAFKSSYFKEVNGFSNNYWGWGLEDDDLHVRLKSKNITCDVTIDNYRRLSSDGNGKTDAEHYMPLYQPNHKFLYEIQGTGDCSVSGLNNLSYKLISIEKYNNINKYIIE
jgi:beta-1,4-galactosyltransferase 1